MREIFSNGAVTRLSRNITPTNTTIYLDDVSNFPVPVKGEEFYYTSLVGACGVSEVEIIRVVETCSNCIKVDQRGAQKTVSAAYSVGDYAYHAITADAMQAIMDSWSWYLGPFCPAPTTDNNGNPLQEGMLYYDSCANEVYVWNGSTWDDLTNPAPTVAAAYTFLDNDQDLTAPFNLPLIDIYGNQMPDLYPDRHLVELFLNGVRQPEEVDLAVMSGSFRVDWNLNRIVMLENVLQGALVEVIIHHIATREELILRTRAHSSGFSLEYS